MYFISPVVHSGGRVQTRLLGPCWSLLVQLGQHHHILWRGLGVNSWVEAGRRKPSGPTALGEWLRGGGAGWCCWKHSSIQKVDEGGLFWRHWEKETRFSLIQKESPCNQSCYVELLGYSSCDVLEWKTCTGLCFLAVFGELLCVWSTYDFSLLCMLCCVHCLRWSWQLTES